MNNALTSKDYVTLAAAARLSPGRPSANAVWRWCRKGIKSRSGIRIWLDHVRIGGRIFTTADAVRRFGEELARSDCAHFGTSPAGSIGTARTDRQRQGAVDRADHELDSAGI